MPVFVAVAGCCLTAAFSLGVGFYLQRFAGRLSEMLGMMVGMTLGMLTSLAAGTWLGLATNMFVSNTAGILIGLAFGVGFGRLGGMMGMLDGGMGGVMGGMMGAMLGVMIGQAPLAVWTTVALIMAVDLAGLAGLVQLIASRCAQPAITDPVCGMEVDPETTLLRSVYNGRTVYFCAPGCKRAFDKQPERYAGRPAPETAGKAHA